MKYVFGASSHLVFYLCNKIIETDSLNPDDCIFFFTRNYHCPPKFNTKYKHCIDTGYNVSPQKGRVFQGIHFRKTRNNIKEFDALVDSYIKGEDFIWYSQICNNDLCSLFVSKSNCVGYYVIEDGLGSYMNNNPQTFTGWKFLLYKFILKPFWRRCFEVKNHFVTNDHPKFKGCIATSDNCFPLFKNDLRCVGMPFEIIELGFYPNAILSVDPIYLLVDKPYEESVFQKISAFLQSKNYKCIAYKFHPGFFANTNKTIKIRYEKLIQKYFGNLPIRELNWDICLENVIMTYKSDFYTSFSAVALYAHAIGATCYSYMPIIRKYQDKCTEKIPLIEDFCIPIE